MTHCFTCHGPDANTRKAKLRLDEREAPGDLAPGKLVDSELIHRIPTEDPDGDAATFIEKLLSAAQKSVLKRWVAAGAPYASHWAFAQPQRPEPPKVKQADWPARRSTDSFSRVWNRKNCNQHPRRIASGCCVGCRWISLVCRRHQKRWRRFSRIPNA